MTDQQTPGRAAHQRLSALEGSTRRLRYELNQARGKNQRAFDDIFPRLGAAETTIGSLEQRLAALENIDNTNPDTVESIRASIARDINRVEKSITAVITDYNARLDAMQAQVDAANAAAAAAATTSEEAHGRLDGIEIQRGDAPVVSNFPLVQAAVGFALAALLAWFVIGSVWDGWGEHETASQTLIVLTFGIAGGFAAASFGASTVRIITDVIVPVRANADNGADEPDPAPEPSPSQGGDGTSRDSTASSDGPAPVPVPSPAGGPNGGAPSTATQPTAVVSTTSGNGGQSQNG